VLCYRFRERVLAIIVADSPQKSGDNELSTDAEIAIDTEVALKNAQRTIVWKGCLLPWARAQQLLNSKKGPHQAALEQQCRCWRSPT